jgi:hypothetical protein
MKRPVWLLIGVVLAVAVAWFALRPGGEGSLTADLVEQFPTATQKRPNPETFQVVEATLGGDTRPAILTRESSRLVYAVPVPDNGELRVSLGLLEEAWTTQGDGVLFRILIGAGAPPEEVLNLLINPFGNPSDRRWHDITIDLSEYAGETIDIYFNTNASPDQRPPVNDTNGDLAVWGAPAVYAR